MKTVGVTLRQLEYFIATAELGTLSAAAAHFHISQTAVSLAISQMEKALGVQLLVRRPAKPPALTAAGRQLLGDARQVLSHTHDLESAARSIGQGVSGRLAVGCFPTITPFVMGRLLEVSNARHPGLAIDLVEDSVEGLQTRLADGLCDVAIMYDIGIGSGFSTTRLYSCPPYAVLSADHRLARRRSLSLAEVMGDPMILIDMPPSADFVLGRLAAAGQVPDVHFRTRSVETVRALVGRGEGWSILLHRPVTSVSYDGGRVVDVDIDDIGGPVDVLVVRHAMARPTRRTEAFRRLCGEILSSAPTDPRGRAS